RQRRYRTIDQGEDRIGAAGLVEALAYLRGGDRPALGLAVAGTARTPVAAEALEERIAAVDAAARRAGLQRAGGIGGRQCVGMPCRRIDPLCMRDADACQQGG